MAEIWATALHSYVVQGAWKGVQEFVDSKAALFGPEQSEVEGEFGEGEFGVFRSFRDLAAKTLDTLLGDLGCKSEADEERLAQWLRKYSASANQRGPREAAAASLLSDLFTVDDFASFVKMMRRRNDELDAFEEGAFLLSRGDNNDNDNDKKRRAEPKGRRHASHLGDKGGDWGGIDDDCDYEDEAAVGELEGEWELQHGIALSILTANEAGKLRDEDGAYVGWAEALVRVAKEMQSDSWKQDPMNAKNAYRELAAKRFNVELSLAQRRVYEERAARAEAAKLISADAGHCLEAKVKAALARCDDLQQEIAISRGACVRNTSVRDANLELGYLLVKSLLQQRQDLTNHIDDIFESLHAETEVPVEGATLRDQFYRDEASASHAATGTDQSIVFDLVRWCAIEAELSTVRKRVASMLNDSSSPTKSNEASAISSDDDEEGQWVECVDSNTNYAYYVNGTTGESTWDPPSDYLPLDVADLCAAAETKENIGQDDKRQEEGRPRSPTTADPALPATAEAKGSSPREPAKEVQVIPHAAAKLDAPAGLNALKGRIAKALPPPTGLPSVPVWGKRLAPLRNDTKDEKHAPASGACSLVKKQHGGLVLSPLALDFLQKRNAQLDNPFKAKASP